MRTFPVAILFIPLAACSVPSGPVPTFGPAQSSTPAPPPLSGGSLLITRSGTTAIVADPDRDRVYVVDLAGRTLRTTLPLNPGDEPGRAVEDDAGHVHVVLRGGGGIATLDPTHGAWIDRRAVCSAPRGIAFDATGAQLDVACAGGELVTLPVAVGAPATRTLQLGVDLRDVVVEGDHLWVSRFRAAQLLVVDRVSGAVLETQQPAAHHELRSVFVSRTETDQVDTEFDPSVAWRTVALSAGGVAMVHQRSDASAVRVLSTGYYNVECGSCSCSLVQSTVTLAKAGMAPRTMPMIPSAVLPIDLAVSPDQQSMAIVAAGNATSPHEPQVMVVDASSVSSTDACLLDTVHLPSHQPTGQAIALAYTHTGDLWVQTREPAALFLPSSGATIALAADPHTDTGHAIFHANSGAFVACASCHPEGGDDGHVWNFADIGGPRRTQNLRGGLLSTAPFHWDGHLSDMATLMNEVFTTRMQGPSLDEGQANAVGHWLDAQPAIAVPPPADPAAVARGQVLFNDHVVGCATCHSGPRFTNNQTVDVGTGGPLQVPSLTSVSLRPPFMHDGCAAGLRDRFGACGGGNFHGQTSQLASTQIADLVAYLQSL